MSFGSINCPTGVDVDTIESTGFGRVLFVRVHVDLEAFKTAVKDYVGCHCCFEAYREPVQGWAYMEGSRLQVCTDRFPGAFPCTMMEKKR